MRKRCVGRSGGLGCGLLSVPILVRRCKPWRTQMTGATNTHEAAYLTWKTQQAGTRVVTGVASALGVAAVFGWVLLLHKISQTSAFALRYSDRVHQQLGEWGVAVGALTLIAIVVGIMAIAAVVRSRRTKDALVASLRKRLADPADPTQRSTIESRLRELGA